MGAAVPEAELSAKLFRFLRTKSPIARAIERVRTGAWHSYLFGGALRDILRPDPFSPGVRDVDIVIDDREFSRFRWHMRAFIVARNRFGGLRLVVGDVPIDAWPLSQTWAFRHGYVAADSYRSLANTTFLNIDSIVANISWRPSMRPEVCADPYITAFHHNVLDIGLRENPYPALVAVKAIRAMYRYQLNLTRPLASYITCVLEDLGLEHFEREQRRHYKRVIIGGEALRLLAMNMQRYVNGSSQRVYSLYGQRELPGFEVQLTCPGCPDDNRYNCAD